MIRDWNQLYKKQTPALLGMCRRYIPCKQEAEDVLHDAFILAMEKQYSYKSIGSKEGWLRKVVLNTVLMHIRKKKAVTVELTSEFENNNAAFSDSDVKKHNEQLSANDLLLMIDTLPHHHKMVFNLYVFENYKHKEIAKELDISEGTSKSHLARARKSLQIMIEEKTDNKRQRRAGFFLLFPWLADGKDYVFKTGLKNYMIQPSSSFIIPNVTTKLTASIITISSTITSIAIIGAATAIIYSAQNIKSIKSFANDQIIIIDSIKYQERLSEKPTKSDTISKNSIYTSIETKKGTNMRLLKIAAISTIALTTTDTITAGLALDTIKTETPTTKENRSITEYFEFGTEVKGWAKVRRDSLYGFINEDAQIVIPIVYNEILDFDSYRRKWAMVKKDNKFGFINTDGVEIIPTIYDEIEEFGDYLKNWALIKIDNKLGFIDDEGFVIVPTKYDEIQEFNFYKSGWALVRKDGKLGFINNEGFEVVPTIYDVIEEFDQVNSNWAIVKKDGKLGFINSNGIEIVPAVYDEIEEFGSINKQWAQVTKNGKLLFIDKEGKEINPATSEKPIKSTKSKIIETDKQEEVFLRCSKMPQFKGGDDSLKYYLKHTAKHPVGSVKTDGVVYMTFIVNGKGDVCKAKVLRGLSPTYDKEALRVINAMPKWTPGEQRRKKVSVKYTYPVYFND